GKHACRHRTDPGHVGAACRSRSETLARRRRKPFCSAAPEGDDHRPRVAKDTPDLGLRNEAGESVEVVELLELGHRQSMTRFPREGKSGFSWKSRGFTGCQGRKLPTRKREEPSFSITPGRGFDDIAVRPSDQYWYRFDLAAGEAATLALKAFGQNAAVSLYGPSGALLAEDTRTLSQTDRAIERFLAPAAGAYYAVVGGIAGADYSLVVTRNATQDLRGNGSPFGGQVLTGTGGVLGFAVPSDSLARLFLYDHSAQRIREIN